MTDGDETSDEVWMEAVCQGDRRAFQALVNRHCQAISHYAYRLLGNRTEAEDISQETFLRLWTQADKWQTHKSKLSTWLHRIAHNLCIDYLRKNSRLQSDSQLTISIEQAGINSEDEDSEDGEDRAEQLQLALWKLPEAQRSALMLCSHSGFSNQQAADIMGVSVKALESTLARARRNLRSQLFAANNSKAN